MNKIFKSISMMAVIAAVAGGATFAIFSATDTISGNTVGTATLKLDAHGEASTGTLAKPIIATNLFPGQDTSWFRGALYNQSTVPVRIYMYLDNVQSSAGSVCDKMNLTVTTGFAGTDAGERARIIKNNVSIPSITGVANRFEVTGVPPFVTAGPNITQVIQQKAQLDITADNAQQNATCTWDEVFVAESAA